MVDVYKNNKRRAIDIIKILRVATKNMNPPASVHITKAFGRDPFLTLISCILSLRTRDTVSLPASYRLFKLATTPDQLLTVKPSIIKKTIYPVGFYQQKTDQILFLCKQLITKFGGKVPQIKKDLLLLKGVGPKTANLVLSEGFGIPALCVDTHVHRISNRLGIINTKTPEETEQALINLLPKQYWSEYSRLLVTWGQNICVPISPFCSVCPLLPLCQQRGVQRMR